MDIKCYILTVMVTRSLYKHWEKLHHDVSHKFFLLSCITQYMQSDIFHGYSDILSVSYKGILFKEKLFKYLVKQ